MLSKETEKNIRGIVLTAIVLAALIISAMPQQAMAAGGAAEGQPVLGQDSDGDSSRDIEAVSDPLRDVPDIKEVFTGSEEGEQYGEQVAGIGDVNNDGKADFAVLSYTMSECTVYYGGSVIREALYKPMRGSGYRLSEQSQIRPAGDINSDGFDDVVITAPSHYLGSMRAVGGFFIFYGTPNGLHEAPDQVLFGDEVDGRYGIDVDSVGDINGDGFDDLLVGADGVDQDTGRAMLMLGGPTGLYEDPVWAWTGENEGDRFGHSVAGLGRLNNDPYLDFAVGAPFAPSGKSLGKVYIFYGKSDIGSIIPDPEPLEGEMLRSFFGLNVRYAGDINNDTFSDLIISAPDYDAGNIEGAGRVEVYVGGEQGVVKKPVRILEGVGEDAHLGTTVACLGDVNNDGYDDIGIGAEFHTSDGKDHRGKFYIYFGEPLAYLTYRPKVEEIGKHAGDRLGAGLAAAGDIDGDNFADVLVGAPGVNRNPLQDVGEVHLYRGSDITMPPMLSSFFEVEHEEDDLILCEYNYYEFRITITHRTDFEAVRSIFLHLDPDGEDVTFRYIVRTKNIVEVNDPEDLAKAVAMRERSNKTYRDTTDVFLGVMLHWGFPSSRQLSVRINAIDNQNLRAQGSWGDQARVVDSLRFTGPVQVHSIEATGLRLLEDGDWIEGSENLEFGGAGVEYDLSDLEVSLDEPYVPLMGTFLIVLKDSLSGEWFDADSTGDDFEIRAVAPQDSHSEIVYSITLETSDRSKVFTKVAIRLGVDATEVFFENNEPTSPIAEKRHQASIEIFDPIGPGADPYKVEYQVDLAGDVGGFGYWRPASTSFGESSVVAETMDEIFTEGVNHVRWRAWDLVGNGPTFSDVYHVVVDLGNITFSNPVPSATVWHNTPTVTVGITIENTRGNEIDLNFIQYRVSTSPGVYSNWFNFVASVPPGSPRYTVDVLTSAHLAEGKNNFIQWRARDLERREYITSPLYRIQVDLSGPSFRDPQPSSDQFVGERNVFEATIIVEDALSGVDESTVQYQIVGEDHWHTPIVRMADGVIECAAMVNLEEGVDNYIRWQAKDRMGYRSPPFDQRIKVDWTAPEFTDFSPTPSTIVRFSKVEVSVRIDDGMWGSGVDLSTLIYTVSRPETGGYSEWRHPVGYDFVRPFYMVTILIEVDQGDQNFIVFNVTDATGENTAMSRPYQIIADIFVEIPNQKPVINRDEPSSMRQVYGRSTFFDASESEDPEGDDLLFSWHSNIDGPLATTAKFSKALSKGEHTITLTVSEANGDLEERVAFTLVVEPENEVHPPFSVLWEQVALVLIIVFVAIAMLLQRWRIKH
jgi:hypothetical protein